MCEGRRVEVRYSLCSSFFLYFSPSSGRSKTKSNSGDVNVRLHTNTNERRTRESADHDEEI